ncbi:MAG: hypothetical protein RLZZ515_1046 [Cyanobacteriota bacterium]|jgi:hypothetical protein
MRYLITIRTDPTDPRRTQDVAVNARNAYHAGWLYRQLNPQAKLSGIRPAPDHR